MAVRYQPTGFSGQWGVEAFQERSRQSRETEVASLVYFESVVSESKYKIGYFSTGFTVIFAAVRLDSAQEL